MFLGKIQPNKCGLPIKLTVMNPNKSKTSTRPVLKL